MNILVLCDRYPSSMQDGLSLRVIHYLRNLRSQHSFDLVCYGPQLNPSIITDLFSNIDVFEKPAEVVNRGLAKILNSFELKSLYPVCEAVKKHIETIISIRSYDVIWDAGSNMLLNLPENSKALPLLADTVDDPVLERWRQFRRSNNLLSAAKNMKNLLMFVRFNQKYISAAAANLLVSELDAIYYSRVCPGKRVEVIHNGVDAEYFQFTEAPTNSKNLVFEGSISFAPNKDGILYFVRDILPLIRRKVPDVTFTIVGRAPPPEILALAGPGITVTGFVDDVRPYVSRAAVFVCPLRSGAGIKNKLLQAWSMGKAVVATTQSIGGLRTINDENIIVRDDPTSFADAVVGLLANPEEAARIGKNARRVIHDDYTWKEKSQQFENLLLSIAKTGRKERFFSCRPSDGDDSSDLTRKNHE